MTIAIYTRKEKQRAAAAVTINDNINIDITIKQTSHPFQNYHPKSNVVVIPHHHVPNVLKGMVHHGVMVNASGITAYKTVHVHRNYYISIQTIFVLLNGMPSNLSLTIMESMSI
jgi:hypothetical protein